MTTGIARIFILSTIILGIFSLGRAQTQPHTGNDPVEPFRIAGNVYYVGASDVTSYLIATREGHILIDSGYLETVPQIKNNIAKLGFKLANVKIILNSHAHFDHAGGIAELRRLTHARFYASEKDAGLLGRGGLDDPNYGDKFPFEALKPDKLLVDGQKITFGGSTLYANVTSGHTPGCTTWTMTVKENGKPLNVLFLCSVSSPDYNLVSNKKYPTIVADYLATFARLKQENVDIFLASHGGAYGLAEKMEVRRKGAAQNPFIDPQGYKDFIAESEKAFLEKLKAQKSEKK